jgi:hypothetical protein
MHSWIGPDVIDVMQRGIYLKCQQMANVRPVKRLQFRANPRRTFRNLSGARMPELRLTH